MARCAACSVAEGCDVDCTCETSALLFVPVSMLRPCLLLIQGILRWHLYHTSYCLLWSVFLQTLVPVVARQGLSHLRHLL